MPLLRLRRPWTRQPQRAVRLKSDDGFYYASVAGRSPTTGQFLTGITEERINADGRAGYINVGPTAQDFGVSVPTGSWAILLNVALLAKPSSYPYLLGISGGPQASLSLNHLSHSGNATWYDGTNIYNSGISVAVGELATVGLVWDAAAITYTWYKNGIQGNTVSGVSTGTGTWRFRTYTDEGSENAINLIAFSNRAIPTARMRELTAKNGQWKIFEPDTLDLWIPEGGGTSTYTYNGSGSVTFSGDAALAKVKNFAGSGSLAFSGDAALSKVKTFSGSGQITYSGDAALAKIKNYAASGSLTYSGAATTAYVVSGATTYTYNGSGQVTFSGATASAKLTTWPYTGTGSITFSGAAALAKIKTFPAAGQITYSGTAVTAYLSEGAAVYPYIGSGSFVFSSTAISRKVNGLAPRATQRQTMAAHDGRASSTGRPDGRSGNNQTNRRH